MLPVVIDTDVLVSALASPDGPPGMIRQAFEEGLFIWCLSDALFAEYEDVLNRPRLRKVFARHDPNAGDQLLSLLGETADWIDGDIGIIPVIDADPDDDVVLATAVACKAAVIVTGDQHLLALEEYQGIRILTPAAFVLALKG